MFTGWGYNKLSDHIYNSLKHHEAQAECQLSTIENKSRRTPIGMSRSFSLGDCSSQYLFMQQCSDNKCKYYYQYEGVMYGGIWEAIFQVIYRARAFSSFTLQVTQHVTKYSKGKAE